MLFACAFIRAASPSSLTRLKCALLTHTLTRTSVTQTDTTPDNGHGRRGRQSGRGGRGTDTGERRQRRAGGGVREGRTRPRALTQIKLLTQLDGLMATPLVGAAVERLGADEYDVKKEALWTVANILHAYKSNPSARY